MAIINDDDKKLSSKQIKDILINTVSRSAEKSVNNADYNKTILATIQYCTDASIGQYKIKYQNGYFTAYAQGGATYANQANVYVLVSGNDMNNRMYILGTVTNDNTQRISVDSIDPRIQYSRLSKHFITEIRQNLDMCTYECNVLDPQQQTYSYRRTLYKHDNAPEDNALVLASDESMQSDFSSGGGYLWLQADFKTALDDEQKKSLGADYGIIINVKYKDIETNNGIKSYVLSTFDMQGSPFNLTSYTQQYNVWEIDGKNFEYIDSIEEYMKGFDLSRYAEDPPQEYPNDIFIQNIQFYNAQKNYDINSSTYNVTINCEESQGRAFENGLTKLTFNAIFSKLNSIVKDDNGQNLQYIWGKQDGSVNAVSHPKYHAALGNGWYCLNNFNIKSSKDNLGVEQATDPMRYTFTASDVPGVSDTVEWVTIGASTLVLPKDMCKGKITKLKCVILYEGAQYESQVLDVINPSGRYLIFQTDRKTFRNHSGYATLTAGLFQDINANNPINVTLNENENPSDKKIIRYVWEEINATGSHPIPTSDPNNILYNSFSWEESQEWSDNTKTSFVTPDPLIQYQNDPSLIDDSDNEGELNRLLCRQRYDFYNGIPTSSEDQQQMALKTEANVRLKRIIDVANLIILREYVFNIENTHNHYILGFTPVEAEYNSSEHNYLHVDMTVNNDNGYFYGSEEYDNNNPSGSEHNQRFNTLYRFNGSTVQYNTTIRITALEVTKNGLGSKDLIETIDTKDIVLLDEAGSSLKYDLQITNGTQTYLYDEAGLSPLSVKNGKMPIRILPLSFKIYDRDQTEPVFDSTSATSEDITKMKPVWSFYKQGESLITTEYGFKSPNYSIDQDNTLRVNLANEPYFYYSLADTFDYNKRENSNIQLQLLYGDTILTASTNFTFGKEGDLGTNGTDTYAQIDDIVYEQYKSSILSAKELSTFETAIDDAEEGQKTITEIYTPNQRHLANTYLFGLECAKLENDSFVEQFNVKNSDYVSLWFAGGATEGDGVLKTEQITLNGYWYENGNPHIPENGKSEWTVGRNQVTGYDGKEIYHTPSFDLLNTGQDSTKSVKVAYWHSLPPYSYKPTLSDTYIPEPGGSESTHIANNVVKFKTSFETNQENPITKQKVERTIYGYYNIPYFYFAKYAKTNNIWENKTKSTNIDPARHIVVTGGFDQVIYDANGYNPQYNKQTDFTVHLFDENNKDITQDLLRLIRHNVDGATIEWSCSDGFKQSAPATAIKNFSEFDIDEPLYGQYCRYDGKVYKCIKQHIKTQKVTTADGTYTYNADGTSEPEFIDMYWQEVSGLNQTIQSVKLEPASVFMNLSHTSLFNSWISVYVRYPKDANTVYEGEALIPINMFCNVYGSEVINDWDGQSAKIDEEGGYMLANSVGAGIKLPNNSFAGIYIGQNFYPDNSGKHNEIGVFGYSTVAESGEEPDPENLMPARTIFMDAYTGRTILGRDRATQIVLNTDVPKNETDQSWSRIAGWYLSRDFFYKPVGEEDDPLTFSQLSQGREIAPPTDSSKGSAGMFVPHSGHVKPTDVFLWASSPQKEVDDEEIMQGYNKYKEIIETEWGGDKTDFNIYFDANGDPHGLDEYEAYLTVVTKDFANLSKKFVPKMDKKLNIHPMYNTDLLEDTDQEVVTYITEKIPIYYGKYALMLTQSNPSTIEIFVDIIQQMIRVSENEAEFYEVFVPECADTVILLNDTYTYFMDIYNLFMYYYRRYVAVRDQKMSGHPTTWRDYNSTKSNFYVTYGGRLHATMADIEGTITASSGKFGSGANTINIAYEADNKKYLLYNRNFWVRDISGEGSDADPAVYIKGKIAARGGQFGDVNAEDGYNSRAVFIWYSWYPWVLPRDDQEWSDETLYLDESKGRNTKYIFYHPNFYLKKSGQAFFNGTIYSEKGRLGNWVLNKNHIQSTDGTIVLSPTGGLTIGKFHAEKSGAIGGDSWSISADGIANFNNPNNTFKGQSLDLGGMILTGGTSGAFELSEGQSLVLGSHRILVTSEGFSFDGKPTFSDKVYARNGIEVYNGINMAGTSGSGTHNNYITFPGSSGGQLRITPDGCLTVVNGNPHGLFTNGNADFLNLAVTYNISQGNIQTKAPGHNYGVTIDNKDFERAIKDIIESGCWVQINCTKGSIDGTEVITGIQSAVIVDRYF